MQKLASKVAEPDQIQPKSQFLFHKNLPPRDFSIMTLTWISVIDVSLVPTVWMGTFNTFMVLMPPNPFWFYCTFAIEFVIVVSLSFRKRFVAFFTFVKGFDFATFFARD